MKETRCFEYVITRQQLHELELMYIQVRIAIISQMNCTNHTGHIIAYKRKHYTLTHNEIRNPHALGPHSYARCYPLFKMYYNVLYILLSCHCFVYPSDYKLLCSVLDCNHLMP
eukprot:556889_1